MRQVMVRYKVKPEAAARNEELVRAVFEELRQTAPAGVHYATFVLEDGVSFVHVASSESADGRNPLMDVAAFRAYEHEISARLATRFPAQDAARLAPALIMGRTREGVPLPEALRQVLVRPAAATADGASRNHAVPRSPTTLNEFDFTADTAGAKCPFHAHVRKMHPRVNAADTIGHKGALIASQPVRRGTLYDPQGLLTARERAGTGSWPDGGVGLLFLAYMADLQAQFEQLHNTWAADQAFPDKHTGQRDPVLLGLSQPWTFLGLEFPPMPPVVRRQGGAYLCAPSIPWLARGGR